MTAVIVINLLWFLGSLIAVLTGLVDFTAVGAVWAIAQAAVVAAFAALPAQGLQQAR